MNVISHIGRYFVLLRYVFSRPERRSIFWRRIIEEIDKLGVNSIPIVALLSVFMGAVIAIQTASNIDSSFIPVYVIGLMSRQSIILELSPTIISLILAGKVGSNIASEIGTMRVTEQIDALDIMGVNSAEYLIAPKIWAAVFINPFVIIISMFLGMFGAWMAGVGSGVISSTDYIYGLQYDFNSFDVVYALIKTVIFAFIITSVSAYHGYYTRGGALEVGRSSTQAVVYSTVVILIANYVLTQILLI